MQYLPKKSLFAPLQHNSSPGEACAKAIQDDVITLLQLACSLCLAQSDRNRGSGGHHKVRPVFNADHKIIDFEPRLNLKHHTQVQNAKRYLRHLENHHADFLFRKNNKGRLMAPWNYVKDAIYEDRNKEMVLAHKVHKLTK